MPVSTKEKYLLYDMEQIKEIPVTQVLSDYGIEIKNNQFKIRDERTPSCHVYPNNTWHDFGANKGGRAIELVMALEDIEFKFAVQMLGSRYNISIINGGKQNPRRKTLSAEEYAYLGLFPVTYKNIITEQNAHQFTGVEQIQQIQEKYKMPMNKLFEENPTLYSDLLEEKALFEIKYRKNSYLQSTKLFAMSIEQDAPSSADYQLNKAFYDRSLAEYQSTLFAYTKAVKYTTLEKTIKQFQIEPEKDLKNIRSQSIEIGDFPYSSLKGIGKPLEHTKLSPQEYERFSFYVNSAQAPLDILYSAHERNETVTLSFLQEDNNLIRGILGTVDKLEEFEQKQEIAQDLPTKETGIEL